MLPCILMVPVKLLVRSEFAALDEGCLDSGQATQVGVIHHLNAPF